MESQVDERSRSLEDMFFRKRDEELLKQLRGRESAKARKAALADVSGISDDNVLQHLADLDVHPEALAAFALLPLIEVAWSDGRVDLGEHRAIMAAVEAKGIGKESMAHEVLDEWLNRRPDAKLLDAWKAYVKALCAAMDKKSREELKEEVLGRAQAVAEAEGGFLGLVGKVSASEAKVLKELAAAFE